MKENVSKKWILTRKRVRIKPLDEKGQKGSERGIEDV
jgi:hypothetical protein